MSVPNCAYSDMATLLLTNVPIHHFETMATLLIDGKRDRRGLRVQLLVSLFFCVVAIVATMT